ncbi:hypothetical protein CANCADRAFT_23784 [Tortispora caseinolytica NRRL Y-17796]|uniref:EF-hand domain-containing protein n=1 Tax=Tortispora caseinolytica NRRL Y-17796 TaxID=767744 RepID=A0A1E4TLD4_9ASCO|nr:hypothetical protein CANCADRAFT_23784 [Tortispora caseinolytica NRRL Y-17796]
MLGDSSLRRSAFGSTPRSIGKSTGGSAGFGGGAGKKEVSEEQRQEIREAFALFDLDQDGLLDYHEFKVAMRALGFDAQKAEVLQLLKENDQGNGKIGFDSFAALMTERLLARDPIEDVKRAFKLFDQDGKGKISFQNLKKVSEELGEKLDDEELQAMIDEFDLDQDGMINEEEFLQICLNS